MIVPRGRCMRTHFMHYQRNITHIYCWNGHVLSHFNISALILVKLEEAGMEETGMQTQNSWEIRIHTLLFKHEYKSLFLNYFFHVRLDKIWAIPRIPSSIRDIRPVHMLHWTHVHLFVRKIQCTEGSVLGKRGVEITCSAVHVSKVIWELLNTQEEKSNVYCTQNMYVYCNLWTGLVELSRMNFSFPVLPCVKQEFTNRTGYV